MLLYDSKARKSFDYSFFGTSSVSILRLLKVKLSNLYFASIFLSTQTVQTLQKFHLAVVVFFFKKCMQAKQNASEYDSEMPDLVYISQTNSQYQEE